ncbi:MAG: MFS transporter [archaeon]|nr:MFS transporter [archaeon]
MDKDKTDNLVNSVEQFAIENKEDKEEIIKLSKCKRWFLVFVFCFMLGSINVSNCVLSASVSQIKKEMNITNKQFGFFGTCNSIGCLLGSVGFSLLNKRVNNRFLILLMICIDMLCNLSIILKVSFYPVLCALRVIDGFCTEMLNLFGPCWAERVAMRKWKSLMMSFILPAFCLGDLMAYFINMKIDPINWTMGLRVEASIQLILFIIVSLFDGHYFSKDIKRIEDKPLFDSENEKENKRESLESKFIDKEIKKEKNEEEENKTKKPSICDVLKNIPFMGIILFKSNKYFISFSISYWYTDYLESALLITNKKEIFFSYLFSFILSYIVGMIAGGLILTCLGGYRGRLTVVIMFILYGGSFLFSLGLPIANNLIYFTFFGFMTVTFEAIAEDMCWSVAFGVLEKETVGYFTGIGDFIFLITSLVPAPYVFGVLRSLKDDARFAVKIVTWYALVGLFWLMIVFIFIHKTGHNK